VIVVRGRDGRARAFFNVCRHRGTRLCEEPQGRFAGGIQCPYHAWTYGLDGALLGAPHMADVPWFDKGEHPLVGAPLSEWEGFLFLNLSPDAAPLSQSLGPLAGRFARWSLPRLKGARSIAYDVRANWKLIFQNFSECYHCPPVHPALSKLSHYRSGANDLREGPVLGGYMAIDEPGGSITITGRMCGAPLGELDDDERRRIYYYSIFPNSFLTIQPDLVMATRLAPLAPDATRVVCEWLFAPETLETYLQLYHADAKLHYLPPGLPEGLGGARLFYRSFLDAFPDARLTLEDFVAEGDSVAARYSVEATHRGIYPSQPANLKGEVHEDVGIYSFDTSKKAIRFRQFHVEGFVVHYVMQPQTTPGTFVLDSEAIENIPAGYRSRETYIVIGPDEFEERFELAEPGKEFELYSRTRLTRAK